MKSIDNKWCFLQKQKLSLTGQTSSLKILQTTPLGSKQKLAVIAWGETQYLLNLGPAGGFLIDKKPLKTDKPPSSKPHKKDM